MGGERFARSLGGRLAEELEDNPEGAGGKGGGSAPVVPWAAKVSVQREQMRIRVCINMHLHTYLIETTKTTFG